MLGSHAKALEEGSFRNRSADFLYMLMIGGACMTAVALLGFIDVYFMGPSLVFMITYIWGRRHNYARLVFMVRKLCSSDFTISMYVLFVAVLISVCKCVAGSHTSHCAVPTLGHALDVTVAWPFTRRRFCVSTAECYLTCGSCRRSDTYLRLRSGILVGHTYYFLEDVWPSIADLKKYRWRRPLGTHDYVHYICGTDPPGRPVWDRQHGQED
jgi:Derlin-2/3